MASRVTRFQRNRRTTTTALIVRTTVEADCSRCPMAVAVAAAAGAAAVAVCTRRSPEIWTGPCRWASCAVACPGRRRPWPVAGSAVAVARTRMGDARRSWATAWSSGAWTPSRGSTWARTAGSGLESSGTRAVSFASSGSPAQNGHNQQNIFGEKKKFLFLWYIGLG